MGDRPTSPNFDTFLRSGWTGDVEPRSQRSGKRCTLGGRPSVVSPARLPGLGPPGLMAANAVDRRSRDGTLAVPS
jgi:hypothetical protein